MGGNVGLQLLEVLVPEGKGSERALCANIVAQ